MFINLFCKKSIRGSLHDGDEQDDCGRFGVPGKLSMLNIQREGNYITNRLSSYVMFELELQVISHVVDM